MTLGYLVCLVAQAFVKLSILGICVSGSLEYIRVRVVCILEMHEIEIEKGN